MDIVMKVGGDNLAKNGPFFSDKITSELNDLSINTPRRVNKFAKNRGFTDFMRAIAPNEGDGAGIIHEGWATKGLLGDEYLFSQFDSGDDLSEQEFRAIVDNLPSSRKSGRSLVKDANFLGLQPDLGFSDTVTVGKDTAVGALNGSIKDILNGREVFTVHSGSSVKDVVNYMASKGVGLVPVMKNEKLIGVFSERDLVKRVIAKT